MRLGSYSFLRGSHQRDQITSLRCSQRVSSTSATWVSCIKPHHTTINLHMHMKLEDDTTVLTFTSSQFLREGLVRTESSRLFT